MRNFPSGNDFLRCHSKFSLTKSVQIVIDFRFSQPRNEAFSEVTTDKGIRTLRETMRCYCLFSTVHFCYSDFDVNLQKENLNQS